MRGGICAECQFGVQGPFLECRRHAPRPDVKTGELVPRPFPRADVVKRLVAIWPTVEPDDGCGEFERRFGEAETVEMVLREVLDTTEGIHGDLRERAEAALAGEI